MSEPTIRDYVQHRPWCDVYVCAECGFRDGCAGLHTKLTRITKPCTCGLDRLLAAPQDQLDGQARYEMVQEVMLERRGIRGEPCPACVGWGVRTYSSTATWRGGIGEQAMTDDVCDRCWGSGDADRPWPSRRAAPPDRQEQPCVCMVDDSLVREWVQKAREVARHKGFHVAAPVPQGERGKECAAGCPICTSDVGERAKERE